MIKQHIPSIIFKGLGEKLKCFPIEVGPKFVNDFFQMILNNFSICMTQEN